MSSHESCTHHEHTHHEHTHHEHTHHEHTHKSDSHHGHSHHRKPNQQIQWAFWLNFAFAFIELAAGFATNSVALLSNSIHDFGDALMLGIALGLENLSWHKDDHRFSYGYRRFSTVSAFLSSLILMLGSLLILSQVFNRIWDPPEIKSQGVIFMAILGLMVNAWAFLKLNKGTSINEKVLTWHFIEDLLGWTLVLISSIFINFFKWNLLDPLLAALLSIWIFWGVFRNWKSTWSIFLQATPSHLSLLEVQTYLAQQPHVANVHHLHIWSLDGEHHILTTHIVLDQPLDLQGFQRVKCQIKQGLNDKFHIQEATIEIEWPFENCIDPKH